MQELENKLGYSFQDSVLLQTALTHSSYANEHQRSGAVCNERLEFLGDSILGLVTAKRLYLEHPEMPEGQMTRLRAELVCEQSLCRAARSLDLGSFLRLGRGEAQGGGSTRPSILADAMEAVLAAVYLDGGMDAAAEIVNRVILEPLLGNTKALLQDYKTILQELVQRQSGHSLAYQLVAATGPDHDKLFTVEVQINGYSRCRGQGHSKKLAEQAAAQDALLHLKV